MQLCGIRMKRYELNDSIVETINNWKPRWYSKYDNEDVLSLTKKENQLYWWEIEKIERFSKEHPNSNVPTLEDQGVTEPALQSFIHKRCTIYAKTKMREIDISLDRLEDVINDCLGRDTSLLFVCIILGALLWGILLAIYGSLIFNIGSIFWAIVIVIVGWGSSSLLILFIFLFLDEIGSPLINHIFKRKSEKLMNQMLIMDSTLSLVNQVKQLQLLYKEEQWLNKDKQKQLITSNSEESMKMKENQPQTVIVNSWPLLEFAKLKGKMQLATYSNSKTGQVFKYCLFTDSEGNQCTVDFDKGLGELSVWEIQEHKKDLFVEQMRDGKLYLKKYTTLNNPPVPTP